MVVVVPGTGSVVAAQSDDAFSDYLDLRTAVIENVGRADIADVFPRLVSLAELRFNRKLRFREQITTVTITLVDGRAPLPDDLAEILSVSNAAGYEYLQQSSQHVQANRHDGSYSIEGDEIVGPLPEGDLVMMYYAEVPPITALTDANWLLSKHPDVYLYGVAFEGAKHTRDVELEQINEGLLDTAIDEARAYDQRTRFSRARVRVAGVTP